jgi:hypothetical protein
MSKTGFAAVKSSEDDEGKRIEFVVSHRNLLERNHERSYRKREGKVEMRQWPQWTKR